jgi:nucleoid DNA-binding protein
MVGRKRKNMTKTLDQKQFIDLLSKSAGFNKGDTKAFYDAFVQELENAVRDGTILKLKNLGRLYYSVVPPRKVKAYKTKNGEEFGEKELPEAEKVVFRLAENIRKSKSREG